MELVVVVDLSDQIEIGTGERSDIHGNSGQWANRMDVKEKTKEPNPHPRVNERNITNVGCDADRHSSYI